ncbi:Hypothetical predicted protein [Paramuricea clavata]|uniref:Uncharacterized protein n=1 Tax=Paramuricea clavata TaxID=317549 RepID=A0A7D9IYX0_PARCT|nr:Hypothetical predicted protein [Paramuricea clavata]
MNGLLDQIPTTRHLLGPIHGVTKLLCLQETKNTEIVAYSLSSTLHPYITILANGPESWPLLLQEIDSLFQTTDNSSIASLLKVFEAFFHHVLYNPKPDYSACKSLHALLLEKASELLKQTEEGVLDNILRLITNHLRIYKMDMESLGHSVSLCHQTMRWFLKNGCANLGMYRS